MIISVWTLVYTHTQDFVGFFSAYLIYLPHLSHLIQLISTLVETVIAELGVTDEGNMQNVQCWGSWTGLRSTA